MGASRARASSQSHARRRLRNPLGGGFQLYDIADCGIVAWKPSARHLRGISLCSRHGGIVMKRLLLLGFVSMFAWGGQALADHIECTGDPPSGGCWLTVTAVDTRCDLTSFFIPDAAGCQGWGVIATEYDSNQCCGATTWFCDPRGGSPYVIFNAQNCEPDLSTISGCGGQCAIVP